MSCPMVPSMMTFLKTSRFCAIFSGLLPPPLSRVSWLRSSPSSPRLFSATMLPACCMLPLICDTVNTHCKLAARVQQGQQLAPSPLQLRAASQGAHFNSTPSESQHPLAGSYPIADLLQMCTPKCVC